jgi:hypothetical protein
MKKLAIAALVLALVAPALAAQAPSFTGKWDGTLTRVNPDGTTGNPNPMHMNLTQKGKVLEGTAGPSAENQWKVEKGVVNGATATFEVQQPNGPLHKFTITVAKDKFAGEIVSELNGQTRNGKVEATKAK